MKQKKESGMLTLIFADNTVQYREKIHPSGSIACMAMNTSKETLDASLPLCKRIAKVNTMISTDDVNPADINDARLAAHSLLKLISQQEPFVFLDMAEWGQRLDKAFTVDAFKGILTFGVAMLNGRVNEEAKKRFRPIADLMALAPILANYYDAFTLLQEHIAPFAESLDMKDMPRTKEAYLSQFRQSFPEEFTLGDGSDSWMSLANVSVQYTAGMSADDGHMQMQKHMHFVSLGGMLRADFFEGLAVGHAPKRCAVCGRWFLTTDARRTKYCNDICPTDSKGRKCRVIGNMRGRAERELAADHPLNKPYARRMNTIDQCLKRGTLDPKLADMMKKLAKDKKQRAKADLSYANGSYLREMEQDALKAEAQRILA